MVDLGHQIQKLRKEIKELHFDLGSAKVSHAERTKQMFKFYADGGSISEEDFQQLAYECGAPLTALVGASLKGSYASAIGTEGKPSFLKFYRWLVLSKRGRPSRVVNNSLPLNFEQLILLITLYWRGIIKGLRWARKQLANTAASESKLRVPKIYQPDQKERNLDIKINIGNFQEAKSGVYLRMGIDKELAKNSLLELRKDPARTRGLLMMDVALNSKDASISLEDIRRNLVVDLKELVDKASLKGFPLEVTDRGVDTIEERDGKTYIRVYFTSEADPLKILSVLLEKRDKAFLSGSLALEFPLSLTDLEQKISPSSIGLKLSAQCSVSSDLISVSRNLTEMFKKRFGALSPGLHAKLICLGFFRSGKLSLKFADPGKFLDWLPEKASEKDEGYTKIFENFLKVPIKRIRDLLQDKGKERIELLPPIVKRIYTKCLTHSGGLDGAKLHLQLDDFVLTADTKGLDFTLLAPEIP